MFQIPKSFRAPSAAATLAFAFIACPSYSATLCVGNAGSGCLQTITQAVALAASGDTIQIGAGIYNEAVILTRPVSLIGAGRDRVIINALGLPNGIFVNGMAAAPASGISGVVISGVTVENANFEGILVANASFITIANTQIVQNNRSLNISAGACPGIPAFETNEGDDCGEGLHLMAVDHSVISNNLVKNNSGGILITDETGPNHDNVITGNTVANNVFDCGITLASHSPAAISGLKLPAGVYHNVISGNTSTGNGVQLPGAGAGVGIFAPGPGNKNYGNVVINNILTNNGMPGVAMHNHANVPGAPLANLDDNVIIGNQISGNSQDTGDAATAGTTGINLFSLVPVNGTVITQNTIRGEQIAIAINFPSGAVQVHLNNLATTTGVQNLGAGTIDANQNYWGCAVGPGNYGCAGTLGAVTTGSPAITPF